MDCPGVCAVPQVYVETGTAERGYTGGLPTELLVEIFAVLSLPDRVRTARVCRRWRSVSLEAVGRLWSTVIGPVGVITPRDLYQCRVLLHRARRALTTWVIRDMYADNFEELCRMTVEHLPHIKVLDVTLPLHPSVHRKVASLLSFGVSSMLQEEAPVLERIRIVNRARLNINGLSILRAPALSAIELQGVDLSCLRECAGSRPLRSLVVDTQATRRSGQFPIDWSPIFSFPLLETLAVGIANPDLPPDVSLSRRPLPPTLKRLSILLRPERLTQLIGPSDTARLDVWRLEFSNAASPQLAKPADMMPYLQHMTPAAASVQFDGNTMHFMVTDAGGRSATVRGLQSDGDWIVPLTAARTLCVGGLGSLPRPEAQAHALFPELEELMLDVTPESTAYTMGTFRWPRLASPGLRAVRLRSAAATRTIPLAAITSLLRDALTVGTDKLAMLALHGVHVSAPDDLDAVAVLHEMAETVTMIATGTVLPECHLIWNRPWDECVR